MDLPLMLLAEPFVPLGRFGCCAVCMAWRGQGTGIAMGDDRSTFGHNFCSRLSDSITKVLIFLIDGLGQMEQVDANVEPAGRIDVSHSKRVHHSFDHRFEIDGGGAAIPDSGGHFMQAFENLFPIRHPAGGEAEGVGTCNSDRGSTTDCEANDTVDNLIRRLKIENGFFMGESGLIEQKKGTVDIPLPAQGEKIAVGR